MTYRTLAAPFRWEIPKIKGSRFLACAAPTADVAAVRAHVDAVRAEFHAARHVCWARVLGRDGADAQGRDDGEPGGSAGAPILAAIRGRELTLVTVAVVRWFGGTKLGVGGLARAYGGAAAEALDRAEWVEVVPSRIVSAVMDYATHGTVQSFAERWGAPDAEVTYAADVTCAWTLPDAAAATFAAALLDTTHGRVVAEVGEECIEAARRLDAGARS